MDSENPKNAAIFSGPAGKTFLLVSIGTLISLLSAQITAFVLGIWVLKSSGSTSQFALLHICALLPMIVASPFAGVVIDKYNRILVIIISNVGSFAITLAILLVTYFYGASLWKIYVFAILASFIGAFQLPSYVALISLLVKKECLLQANGVRQFVESIPYVFAPLLGGLLVANSQGYITDVLLFSLLTSLIALGIVFLSKQGAVTQQSVMPTEVVASPPFSISEFWLGWQIIYRDRLLFNLTLLFAAYNFVLGFVTVLSVPLVLTFSTELVLGYILAFGGLGMLMGSLIVSLLTHVKNIIVNLLFCIGLGGIAIMGVGLSENIFFLSACAFMYFLGVALSTSFFHTLWQSNTKNQFQGKVFAARNVVLLLAVLLAILAAGPVVDYLFKPMFRAGGWLYGSRIAEVIGIMPGQGIKLAFLLSGVSLIALSIRFFFIRKRFLAQTPGFIHAGELGEL